MILLQTSWIPWSVWVTVAISSVPTNASPIRVEATPPLEGGAGEVVRRKLLYECNTHTLFRRCFRVRSGHCPSESTIDPRLLPVSSALFLDCSSPIYGLKGQFCRCGSIYVHESTIVPYCFGNGARFAQGCISKTLAKHHLPRPRGVRGAQRGCVRGHARPTMNASRESGPQPVSPCASR